MNSHRLQQFEAHFGERLPEDYRAYVLSHPAVSESNLGISDESREFIVRTIYALDDGDESEQLDRLYMAIGRVLPPKSFAFASDWGGDMFLLFLPSQNRTGVYYWSHERELGDDAVEQVSDSFTQFMSRLSPVRDFT